MEGSDDSDSSEQNDLPVPDKHLPFDDITGELFVDGEPLDMYVDIDGVQLFAIAESEEVGGVDWKLGISSSGMMRLTINSAPNGVVPDNFIADTNELKAYAGLIDEILFDSSIETIGENAFRSLTALKSVKFNPGVGGTAPHLTTIKGGAFNGCINLSSINLQDCSNLYSILNTNDSATGEQLISGGAFANTGLTYLSLPNSLSMIGSCSFYGCENLRSVYFAENYNISITLGSHIFAHCTSLETVNLENLKSTQIVTITGNDGFNAREGNGFAMFAYCSSLKSLTVPSGFGYNGGSIVNMCWACKELKSFTFQDNNNFTETEKLKNFINSGSEDQAPRGITVIDFRPLTGLTKLSANSVRTNTSVLYIPSTVKTVGACAISDCDVSAIIFDSESQLETIENEGFRRVRTSELNFSDTLVNYVGNYAMANSSYLNKVVFSDKVDELTLGENLFANSSGIGKIILNVPTVIVNDEQGKMFEGVKSVFEMSFGPRTDTITYSLLKQLNGTNGKIAFYGGSNSFSVEAVPEGSPSYSSMGLPFDDNGGHYLADDDGNIYKLDADKNEATLVFVNESGVGTFTVPESISDDNSNTYIVNAVGAKVFSDRRYSEIVFVNSNNITSLGSGAFAGARSLSKVNNIGPTYKVSEVRDTFPLVDLTAGEIAALFSGTRITQDAADTEFGLPGTKTEGKRIDVYVKDSYGSDVRAIYFALPDNFDGNSVLTGQTVTINANFGNPIAGKSYRFYVKVDEHYSSADLAGNGFTQSNVPGVYYREFPYDGTNGSTVVVPLNFTYYKNDAPGTIYAWAVAAEPETFAGEKSGDVIYPESKEMGNGTTTSGEYFEIKWKTYPKEFVLNKEAYAPRNDSEKLKIIPFKNGNITEQTISNLKYTIETHKVDSTADSDLGNDYVYTLEYRDVLQLPEGVKWRDGLLDALRTSSVQVKNNSNNNSYEIYVTIDGTMYHVCTIDANDSQKYTGISLERDGDNLAVCWSFNNPDITNGLANQEIPSVRTNITFADGILLYTPTEENVGESIKFTNNVSTEYVYSFSEVQNKEAQAESPVVSSTLGRVDINKDAVSRPKYFGEDITYQIRLSNPSNYDFTGDVVVTDILDSNSSVKASYITPANIERLFDDPEFGQYVKTVTITNASITKAVVTGNTVIAVDGETETVLSADDTGEIRPEYNKYLNVTFKEYEDSISDGADGMYTGTGLIEDDKNIESRNATITITRAENGKLHLVVTGNDGSVHHESDVEGSLEYALENITYNGNNCSYIVTASASYSVVWNINEFELSSGETKVINFTATAKNTFQNLASDWEQWYEFANVGQLSTDNWAGIDGGGVNNKRTTLSGSTQILPELKLKKKSTINGVSSDGYKTTCRDGDIIDYTTTVSHSGTSTYDVLPLVDNMFGPQVLLVDKASNADNGAQFADCENYLGTYYVLDVAEGTTKTFKNVCIDGRYADSVTVSKENGVVNTVIKWYFKDLPDYNYEYSINYKAKVKLDGVNGTAILGNFVWLNDHAEHRLFDKTFYIGVNASHEKDIVTDLGNPLNPADDIIANDDSSSISSENTEVIYRFDIDHSGYALNIGSDSIFDALPNIFTAHKWSADDIKIMFVEGGSYTFEDESGQVEFRMGSNKITTFGEWLPLSDYADVTMDNPSQAISFDSEGQQFIKWKNGFSIHFPKSWEKAHAYMYIKLAFPSDADEYDDLFEKYGMSTLTNTLYLYDLPSSVSHTFLEVGKVLLQKGVYETAYVIRKQSATFGDLRNENYIVGPNRKTFSVVNNMSDLDKHPIINLVTYYVTLKNCGKTKLYITNLYDLMPREFNFLGFCSTPENHTKIPNSVYTRVELAAPENPIANPEGKLMSVGLKMTKATVNTSISLSPSYRRELMKIEVSGTNDENSIKMETEGKYAGYYYLAPDEGIQFGIVGYAKDDSRNGGILNAVENDIIMEYIDYNGAGAPIMVGKEEQKVVVHDNGLDPNDGDRYVLTDDEVEALGYRFGNDDKSISKVEIGDNTAWLASSVIIEKGSIIPGISKKVKGEKNVYSISEPVDWEITVSNQGDAWMDKYTIEDTIESPHSFKGKYTYTLFASTNLRDGERSSNRKTWKSNEYATAGRAGTDQFYLFDIDYRAGEDHVSITPNHASSNSTVQIKFSSNSNTWTAIPTQMTAFGTWDMGNSNLIYVQAAKNGNDVILRIRFDSKAWAILPGGYGVLGVTTEAPIKQLEVIDEEFNLKKTDIKNVATVIPYDLNYYGKGVTRGKNIVENGKNKGVQSSAVVSVYDTFPTASVEKITETDDEENSGISNDLSNNSIFVNSTGKKVTYTLEVLSDNGLIMEDLVIINTLPDKGDTLLFSGSARNSDFTVAFGKELADAVQVKVYTRNADGDLVEYTDSYGRVTVQYSDYRGIVAPDVDLERLDKEDWAGGTGHGWYETITESSRSLRVIFNTDDVGNKLPPNAVVRVIYNADIVDDGNISNGDIAWSSFGYQYHPDITHLSDESGNVSDTDKRISAAPLEVGVGVPNELSISKQVSGQLMRKMTFRYVIYKGDAVKPENYTELGLAEILSGKEFTVVELTVDAGASESETVVLNELDSNVVRYHVVDGELTKTETPWTWETGEDYNVVEIEDFGSNIQFYKINNSPNRTYSFTYDPATELSITGINTYLTGNEHTLKVEGSKTWVDDDDRYENRPESITINLLANGKPVDTMTVTADNGWRWVFNDLPIYDEYGVAIKYEIAEAEDANYVSRVNGYNVTNTSKLTYVEGSKTWKDNDDQDGKRPESIRIILLADGVYKDDKTVTESEGWAWTFDRLDRYDSSDGHEIKYTITEDDVPSGYTSKVNGYNVTNTHEPEKVKLSGEKTWDDNNNHDGMRPKSITINLYANGMPAGSKTVNEANGWSWTFDNLDKYADGEEIEYTITENPVPGYDTGDIQYQRIDGGIRCSLTNTHVPEKTKVEGSKTWDDSNNQDGKRPDSITINLYADDKYVESKTVTEADDWSWTFDNLDKYANGDLIKYTITEEAVDDYTSKVEGYNVTNTHEIEKTEVSGTKTWKDNENQDGKRPDSITIRLYADKQFVDYKNVTAANGWSWKFTGLDKYAGGKEIEYTITEDAVDDYTSKVEGCNVTNTHEIEKTEVSGTKTWKDNENQDGKRPDSITIRLYADKQFVDYKNVTAANGWSWKFTGLDKYAGGKEIEYTITEDEVDGYTSSGGTKDDGYNLTNTHEIEKTKVEGSKTWDDNENQDGKRPESITINLVGTIKDENNKDKIVKEASLTVAEEDGWKWSFENLDKYSNGKLIEYTITEDAVDDYTSKVDDYNVTNTHEIEKTKVEGSKTWEDNENQDGKRPAEITINLYADGEFVKSLTVTEDENGNWSWTFDNLDKYAGGKEIEYTITEDEVDGYTSSGGTKNDEYNLKNTHTPETTSLTVKKEWDDGENQDGKQPTSVTVKLVAKVGETEVEVVTESEKQVELNAGNNWSAVWTELPVNKEGKAIEYSVVETNVPDGYTATYSGIVDGKITITNTHIPSTVSIPVTKTWNDDKNRDGIRPTEITFNVIDGKDIVASKTVTAKEGWKWTFENLPEFKNGEKIEYKVTENPVTGYTTTVDGYNVTNTHTPETVDIAGTKTWNDNNNQDGKRPEQITINLLANDNKVRSQIVEPDADGNWKWEFKNLPKYANGNVIKYTITENRVEGYDTRVIGYNVTNTRTPETVDISGTKTWVDNDDQDGKRPESITINLLADGKIVDTKAVTKADGWKWTFKDLPKYKNGNVIKYTITENRVEGYTTKVSGYNVTNTRTPETVDISGTKTWVDNDDQDGKRPESITINLLANGKIVETKEVTADADGNWKWTFKDLPKYKNGEEIEYAISEDRVVGYTTKVSGYNVTNTHNTETVDISGKKTWADNNNQDGKRPDEIRINLLANGEVVDYQIVTEDENGNWEWTFEDLPKYANGEEIEYTITEGRVEGYTTKVNGYNVTNTYTPETVDISGKKTWADNDNQDGKRPDEITINLYADGEFVDSQTVTEDENGNWEWSFEDLPKYSNGDIIKYTITENRVDGYTTKVSGYNVTNTRTPETVDISGTKTWADNDNQDGKRPERIKINLLANGEVVETKVVTEGADGSWKWSFKGLPKYANGEEIEYTITEDRVVGYTTKVTGYNVTNTRTPETVEISGTKTWADNNNQDGKRPERIRINLLANGEVVETKVVTEGADGSWKWSFKGLPKYANGEEIEYTITEGRVEGYTTKVNGYNVTNTYTPETVDISGKKTWADSNNQDGKRPDKIRINLLANGEVVDYQIVTEDENGSWEWSFEDLPKYADGEEIEYTITEDRVVGYTTKVTGYNVTNTRTPETVEISGTKTWADNDNQDGKRPDKIRINLLANGEVVETKVVTEGADGSWKWSFKGLPKYADGEEIVYTITENRVDGYSAKVDGYNVTNTHTPETVEISGSKTWVDDDNRDGKRPERIRINLLADGVIVDTKVVTEGADGSWKWSFKGLPKYSDGVEIKYTITENRVEGYTTKVDGYNVTNTHTPETVAISGSKTWVDDGNRDGKRPDKIKINLYADGVFVESKVVTEGADGSWKWSFRGLPKYADGVEIVYTVTEDNVKGYTTVIDGYNVTNTHEPEKVNLSGEKTWVDNNDQDGKRPDSITINLLADGEVVATKTVTEADGWKWSFENLDKYSNGKLIVYTITEEAVEGYTTVVDGLNVTNTHEPEKVNLSGEKTWVDNNNQDGKRPESITINLLADGTVVATKTVTEEDGWKWTFENLDKYSNGKLIVYTVTEEAVEGYTTVVDGLNVTNTHEPEKVNLSGEKTWVDNNNQDGKRPDSITINLLADGTVVATKTVTEADGWKWTFENLDKYSNGKLIVYTVTEEAVEGYTTVVDGLNVTNTHEPEKVNLSGEKTWVDNNNQDGKRPDSITINLLADGTVVATKTVTEADGWKWSFENLDKYSNGKLIVYTVTENEVEGYTTVVDGLNVTNTHEPEKVNLSGEKTWVDNNNQDGKRPDSITINLLADGTVVATKTVTEADGWKWTFENLDKYSNGKLIVYTITEDEVDGYTTVVDGYNVTNTYEPTNTPETTSISGAKTWVDDGNRNGRRPGMITINLFADGELKETKNVTAMDGWRWTFDNLPVYANGKKIVYTITEDFVAGYVTVIDGYNVINTIISNDPETVFVSGHKIWEDDNNSEGARPSYINIRLLADGRVIRTITVTEADGWSWYFGGLPKYNGYQMINYTIEEEPVKDYAAIVDGYNIINYYAPEIILEVPVEGITNDADVNVEKDGVVGLGMIVMMVMGLAAVFFGTVNSKKDEER